MKKFLIAYVERFIISFSINTEVNIYSSLTFHFTLKVMIFLFSIILVHAITSLYIFME